MADRLTRGIRRCGLLLVLATATAFAASHEQRGREEPSEFTIVAGDGYEGAIVPASSLWHEWFRIGITRDRIADVRPSSQLTAWTPQVADIAATERYFIQFVRRAVREPSAVLASLPEEDRRNVEDGLPWLAANVRTLKRQYWGFSSGAVRHIAVHGEPDDANHRWRFEGRIMMDGGCANFWLDFNVTEQRIERFTCGGSA